MLGLTAAMILDIMKPTLSSGMHFARFRLFNDVISTATLR